MILRFQAPARAVGYSMQIELDTEKKIYKAGYFVFNSCFETFAKVQTKNDILKIAREAERNGFKREND